MPFDPLSIIGYVGVGIGLVNFLLSTVSRIEQFQRDYSWAKHKLQWHNAQLSSISITLTAWNLLWCENMALSDKDYEFFWGHAGFSTVKCILQCIQTEMGEIGRQMYNTLDNVPDNHQPAMAVRRQDWSQWQRRLQRLQSQGENYVADLNVLQKLLIASFRGSNLDERMKRLRDQVNDLSTVSNRLLVNIHFWMAADQKADSKTLRQLQERNEWMIDTCDLLTQLYTSHGNEKWSLILYPPDNHGEASSIDGMVGMDVEFHVEIRSANRELSRDEFVTFRRSVTGIATSPHDWCEKYTVDLVKHEYLTAWFTNVRVNSRENRLNLARAALGIVNWTMLLWQTPWTEGICCCKMRFISLARPKRTVPPQTSFFARGICEKTKKDHIERKALLMGVSLSELALKCNIIVSLNPTTEEPTFSCGDDSVSKEALLRMVKNRNGLPYKQAVEFCFQYDEALAKAHKFHHHDIITFKENVTDRLEIYLRALEQGR